MVLRPGRLRPGLGLVCGEHEHLVDRQPVEFPENADLETLPRSERKKVEDAALAECEASDGDAETDGSTSGG